MKKNDRDAAQKRYWEDSSRISEIVNYVLFDGAQVVGPDAILDTAWEASVQVGAAGAKKSYRRTRGMERGIFGKLWIFREHIRS